MRPYPVPPERYLALSMAGVARHDDSILPGLALTLIRPHLLDFVLTETSPIWPEPAASLMRRHSRDWLANGDGNGEVLRICAGQYKFIETVGITGWYEVPGHSEFVGLRWHGLLSQWRGRGLSALVLRILARRIAVLQPEARYICEAVLPGDEDIFRYFRRLGFTAAPASLAEDLISAAGMPAGSTPIVGGLEALAAETAA